MTGTLCAEPLQNMCLLYGFFGGMIGSLCMGWLCAPLPPREASLGVVDLQTLVSQEQGAPSRESRERSQLAKSLEADLELFARQHNLILLHKETVASGDMPDKTAAFLAWLGAKKQGEDAL